MPLIAYHNQFSVADLSLEYEMDMLLLWLGIPFEAHLLISPSLPTPKGGLENEN